MKDEEKTQLVNYEKQEEFTVAAIMEFQRIGYVELQLAYYNRELGKLRAAGKRRSTVVHGAKRASLDENSIPQSDLFWSTIAGAAYGDTGTKTTGKQEQGQIVASTKYNTLSNKHGLLPQSFILQQYHVEIEQITLTLVTNRGSRVLLQVVQGGAHYIHRVNGDEFDLVLRRVTIATQGKITMLHKPPSSRLSPAAPSQTGGGGQPSCRCCGAGICAFDFDHI